jgi:hypothetical protein
MRLTFRTFFAALVCTGLLFATEEFKLEESLVVYHDVPEAKSFGIVFLIPGSQKESTKISHNSLKKELLARNFCPVTLEKRGILEGDEIEYASKMSIEERVKDHVVVIEKLQKGLIEGWNGKISIIGQGDGGRIGASLARRIDSVAAIILIGSGGAWPVLDETLFCFRAQMVKEGFSPQYIQSFLVQAKQEFEKALQYPKPEHKAFGYNYKYWESLLKNHLMDDLSSLKCPIYYAHGKNDDRVPLQSAESMAKALKTKITFVCKEKMGREISQNYEIYEEALDWLQKRI